MARLNSRPCGTCRHVDERELASGAVYCWRWYRWTYPEAVVEDCTTAERADGGEPPGRIHFEGERS